MANIRDTLSHTKWLCKYHIVFTPKYRRKAIYGQYKEKYRQDTEVALQLQGSRDNRRSSHAGPHPHARKYTTEVQRVAIHGVSERQE